MLMLFTLIIGYEWLTSGLSKVFSHSFVTGFHHNVESSLSDSYHFYDPILKALVLPNAALFGYFIEGSELFIGAVFLVICFAMFRKTSRWLLKIGMVASALSAFLSLNIFLYSGDSFFVKPSDPFSESVSLDLLLAAMQVVLLAYFYKLNQSAAYMADDEKQSYAS